MWMNWPPLLDPCVSSTVSQPQRYSSCAEPLATLTSGAIVSIPLLEKFLRKDNKIHPTTKSQPVACWLAFVRFRATMHPTQAESVEALFQCSPVTANFAPRTETPASTQGTDRIYNWPTATHLQLELLGRQLSFSVYKANSTAGPSTNSRCRA